MQQHCGANTHTSTVTWNVMSGTKQAKIAVNLLRLSDAYIRVDNLTIIASDNGLLPGWRQAII